MRHSTLGVKTPIRFLTSVMAALALWGGSVLSVRADSGFLTGLSVTAAPGPGASEFTFTVGESTLTSTTTTPVGPVSFSGALDFGDGSSPASAFPLDLIQQKKRGGKGGTVVWTDTLQGAISHTYPATPAPMTYTAKVSHCCLADIYVSSGYVAVTQIGSTVTDTVQVNIPDPNAVTCQEQTAFAQLDCLFSTLTGSVNGAGIDPPLTVGLVSKLDNALNKKKLCEAACVDGNETLAKTRLGSSQSVVESFEASVNANKGAGRRIPDAVGDPFIAQGNGIIGVQQGLLDAASLCAAGTACLPDPPLGAANCELDRLIAAVSAAGLDAKLTASLVKLLTQGQDQKDDAEALCESSKKNKEKQAANKLKAALSKMTAFATKVSQGVKKGTITQAVADGFLARVTAVSGFINTALQNGACS